MISLPLALGLSVTISFGYVASLYVWRIRSHRDSPELIKRRFLSVGVASVGSTFLLTCVSSRDWRELVGLQGDLIAGTVVGTGLTALLYLGEFLLRWEDPDYRLPLWEPWEWTWWRTVVVGPLTEEWVFRGCLTPLLRGGGMGVMGTALASPVLFGLAHLHHYLSHLSLGNALFQLLYTTAFGLWASFLHLRTGSLGAPVGAHVVCNLLGIPAFEALPTASWRVRGAFVVGPLLCLLWARPATAFASLYLTHPFAF